MNDAEQENAPDARHINLHDNQEVRYWCAVFNVTPSQLRHAVEQSGPSAHAVLRYLSE
jgi:hypothetical protein